MFSFINIIILLAIIFGLIFLQIKLCKHENKWLGLILPCLVCLLSFMFTFGSISYQVEIETQMTTTSDDNTSITEYTPIVTNNEDYVFQVIYTLLFINIPTIILLVIYLLHYKKVSRVDELKKMQLNDL